jgi:hypothetical protein
MLSDSMKGTARVINAIRWQLYKSFANLSIPFICMAYKYMNF